MSFSLNFTARSRLHALRVLGERQKELPAPVHAFIKSAIENMQPVRDQTRVILVEASGHLCEGGTWSPYSSATIKVQPIDIPD